MHLTESQRRAINIILSGANVVLTGSAGTGKTEVIRRVREAMEAKGLSVLVNASTGKAASHISGINIHSALRTFDGSKGIVDLRNVESLHDVKLLIVEEISMIDSRMTNFLYHCVSLLDRPIQIVAVGDFSQLPPVNSPYAFESPYWDRFDFTYVHLTEVVRQNDKDMIDNLALIAAGKPEGRWHFINNASTEELDGGVYLCSTNVQVRYYNKIELEKIPGRSRDYLACSNAPVDFSTIPPDEILTLKENMDVMTLINDSAGRYQNGSILKLAEMKEESVILMNDAGSLIEVGKYRFYADICGKDGSQAYVEQLPLRPAYALTIHKAQGQTFDKANIYSGSCHLPGQLYTALSRVKTTGGIYLMNGIWPNNVVVNSKVREFYERILR